MSDSMVQLQNNAGEKTAMHPSNSSWIAHWMTPTCDSSNLLRTNLQEATHEISSCLKRSGKEGEARTYNIVEDNSLGSSKIDREERLDLQPFPMFSLSKKRKSIAQIDDPATSSHFRSLSLFHYKSEHLKSVLAGEASQESEKELKRSQLLLSQTAMKTGGRAMKTVLPGKNNQFHRLLTPTSNENHMKLQSMAHSLDDVGFHADLNHTKSIAGTYESSEQSLSSQWIEHFKMNSSKFANSAPKSRKGEATSDEMTDEFISKIMNTHLESSGERRQYVQMAFNQTANTFEKKVTSSGMERQIQEKLFSDPWISRWRFSRDAFPLKKPRRDPHCSKLPLDQTQLEQFSRIASMALMGKTMTRKYSSLQRGSTRVWNMEGF